MVTSTTDIKTFTNRFCNDLFTDGNAYQPSQKTPFSYSKIDKEEYSTKLYIVLNLLYKYLERLEEKHRGK